MHTIYLITNLVNWKRYVGQTVSSLEKRWSRHLTSAKRGSQFAIHRALRKYGAEGFRVVAIEICESKPRADDLERRWIKVCNSKTDGWGYNLVDGGSGGLLGFRHSPESIARIVASNKGQKRSSETCAKLAALGLGRKASAATKQKMSLSQSGRKHPPEVREKIAAARRGTKRSEETCRKLSERSKGRIPSAETRARMAESQRRRYAKRGQP